MQKRTARPFCRRFYPLLVQRGLVGEFWVPHGAAMAGCADLAHDHRSRHGDDGRLHRRRTLAQRASVSLTTA